jgi:hypothetical protein
MLGYWISFLSNTLPLLLGVVVGGLITYLTTHALETQRWKQQKKDKYLEDRREALKLVLDWIDPIDRAINRAAVLANPFRMTFTGGNARRSELKWPDLLTEIAKMDLHPSSRYLLPPGIYSGANIIIAALDEIGNLDIQLTEAREQAVEQRKLHPEKQHHFKMDPPSQFGEFDDEYQDRIRELQKELLNKLDELRELANQYRTRLQEEYNATYN